MEPSERTSLSGAQTQWCQATEMQLLRFFGALPQRAEPSQWCQLPWKDVSPAAAPQSVSQTLHLESLYPSVARRPAGRVDPNNSPPSIS